MSVESYEAYSTPSPPPTPASSTTSTPAQTADGGGLRFNNGKLPLELVPVEALESMAEVLRFGAKKYAPRNWERGMKRSICYACAMRHLTKWFRGEDKDEESGLSHLDHALTNLAMLVTYERRGIGADDRPSVPQP